MATDVRPAAEARAVAALDAAAIRWAALRDDPLAPGAADIDVLVHPVDAARLDAALRAEGFARLRTWRHGDHRFFIAYDEERDAWTKVDAVTSLAYRSGRELPRKTVDAVLARAERHGGAMRLHPDDEFWALLLHCLLDRGEVPDRHRDRLQQLAEHDPSGPLRDALAQPTATSAAVEFARAGDVDRLVALGEPLQARLRRPSLTRRVRHGLLGAASPLLKAALRPGIAVALLGPDGAGKSTLARSLRGTFPIDVSAHYLGLYGERARRARALGLPGQMAMAWSAYLAAGIQRRRGRLVIFDRYGYDALLPSARGGWKRAVRGALLGRMVPRPDLVVVLDTPAVTLHGRKAEHDVNALELRREGYRLLARRLASGGATEVVDASVDAETVRRRVTRLIWRTFAHRRGGLRNSADGTRDDLRPVAVEESGAHGDR